MRPMLAAVTPLIAFLAAGCTSAPAAAPPGSGVARVTTAPRPPDTYLAEGQDASGTTVQRPRCTSGCPLNSLGTVVLYDMRWSRWGAVRAAGTGTATLQECRGMCSGMPQFRVRVRVAFSGPVRDCRTGQAYWTRVRFGYPAGAGGAPVPPDPWTFTSLTAAVRAACAGRLSAAPYAGAAGSIPRFRLRPHEQPAAVRQAGRRDPYLSRGHRHR